MFHLSPTKLRVATNTASQLIGKFFSAGTTFLVTLLLARQFGAQGYGDFTKITTFVAFFFLLADFGLNAVYLQKNRDGNMWTSLLSLRLVGGAFLVFVAIAILAFVPQGQWQGYTSLVRLGIILFTPAILFQALVTTANAVFQQRLRYDLATVAIFVGSLVTIFLIWILTRIGVANILPAVAAILLGSAATALIGLWLVRPFVPSFHVSARAGSFRSLFLPALPLGLTLLFNLVYFRIDSVILTLSRSTAEVGLYGLAYKVFEVPLVIPTFFMNAVYPLLLAQQNEKSKMRKEKFMNILKTACITLFIGSLVMGAALWAGAPLLTLVKSDFLASIAPLRILSLGLPFFFLSSLTMWALIAVKKQGLLALIYGISMLVNILLNSIYIPVYGYMAAAWVTVTSEAVVLAMSVFVLLRVLSTDREHNE